jgi:hypothetical protein
MKLKVNATERTVVTKTPKNNVSSLDGVYWNFKVGTLKILMGYEISRQYLLKDAKFTNNFFK